MQNDIWEVVEDSHKNYTILKSLNSTFIALIPKEEVACSLTKFCPIALCNALYKSISKVMENRLNHILPLIISEEQSIFVEGRQIMDNILLAHEMIHSLQSQKKAGMII